MKVSIVIAAYNRPGDLDEALASIRGQTRPADEVLVVDDSTDDGPERVVRSHGEASRTPVIRYLRNPRGNHLTVKRNLGVERTSGDLVVFLDDDVVLDPGYLAAVVAFFERHPEALGLQGHIALPPELGRRARLVNRFSRLFLLHYYELDGCRVLPSSHTTYPLRPQGPVACQWLSGCNMAYRRGVFDEFRFDEKLKRYAYVDDLDFSYRVWKGHRGSLFLLPEARLVHKVSPVARTLKRETTYLRNAYSLYFFYKNMNDSWKSKLARKYCKLGEFLAPFVFLPFSRSPRYHLRELRFWVSAQLFCLRHRDRLKAGELSFLDPYHGR
jgi:GT2 family glycosyltransferase